jgi:CRISPR system Cascade subunit CasB
VTHASAHARAFAEYLQSLVPDERAHTRRDGRAALAALRRGLGKSPGEELEPFRYIGWALSDRGQKEEEAHYLVASLFALHQIAWTDAAESARETGLGASFRVLANRLRADRGDSNSVDRRFVALLNCHADDLATHLRHAVSLLKSQDVPVDWAQLLDDVEKWDDESGAVRRRWARAFWGSAPPPAGDATGEAPADDDRGATEPSES